MFGCAHRVIKIASSPKSEIVNDACRCPTRNQHIFKPSAATIWADGHPYKALKQQRLRQKDELMLLAERDLDAEAQEVEKVILTTFRNVIECCTFFTELNFMIENRSKTKFGSESDRTIR